MIKIAHAVYDENGKSYNGQAGDQTKKEVCIWNWYKSGTGWTHVFRAKDKVVAKKISEIARAIVANEKIGYDQYNRTSLYNQAIKVGYDINQITTACECDCSAMVAVCINAAGIPISKDMRTATELNAIKTTKAFEVLTDSKYLTSGQYLQDGDIIMRNGHTAVAVDMKRKLQLTKPYMRGEDVKVLQELIGAEPDGVYGPDTDGKLQAILNAAGM